MKRSQFNTGFNIFFNIIIYKNALFIIFSSVNNSVADSFDLIDILNNPMLRITKNIHHNIDSCCVVGDIGDYLIEFSSGGLMS